MNLMRKKILAKQAVLFVAASCFCGVLQAQDLSKDQILAGMKKNKPQSMSRTMSIVTVKKGSKRKDKLKIQFIAKGKGSSAQSVIGILAPVAKRGIAILKTAGQTYLYLPSQGNKLTKLGGGGKSGGPTGGGKSKKGIFGSEFAPADIAISEAKQNIKKMPDKKLGSASYYVFNVTEKNPAKDAYTKRVFYISKSRLLPIRVYLYQGAKVAKVVAITKTQKYGDYWMPEAVVAVNKLKSKKSQLTFSKTKVNPKLDDALFTKRAIFSKRYLKY